MKDKVRDTLLKLYEEKMDSRIYKNPSWEEIEEAVSKNETFRDRIKFVANHKTKNLFISTYDTDHYTMIQYTKISGRGTDVFFGKGTVKNNSIEMKDGPSNAAVDKYILNGDYDWLKEYNFEMRDLKDKIRKFLEQTG